MLQLIRDLDNTRYATRKKAEEALAKLGRGAESSLRWTLAKRPTPEMRLRIQRLLRKLNKPITSPEILRAVRAVQVLEYAGTEEAKALLQQLAQGAGAAPLTQEAKAALERLAKMPRAAP